MAMSSATFWAVVLTSALVDMIGSHGVLAARPNPNPGPPPSRAHIPRPLPPQAAEPRDVSECLTCSRCVINGENTGGLEPPEVDPNTPYWNKYLPSSDPNEGKARCDVCTGCTAVSSPLQAVAEFKGFPLEVIDGHSSASIFRVSTPRARKGYAIAKIWCLPFSGHECDTDEVRQYHRMVMDKILAVDRVSTYCGFDEIVPRSWIETITTIIPGLGYAYSGEALMMDVAEGVSFKALDKLPPELQADIYGNLNHTQILLAGIFDALIQQRDRNTGNIFLSESNQLSLIDNDKVLSETIDSAFLPNTQYYNTAVFGREYVRYNGYNVSLPPSPLSPRTSVALDYRCHVHGGVLGTRFPDKVAKCLHHMTEESPEKLLADYGIPDIKYAANLFDRARALLRYGMEWTLEHSTVEHPCLKFFWHKPCCRWRPVRNEERERYGTRMRCADEAWAPWALEHKLPCKGFDYMYVKYKMFEECDTLQEPYDPEWLSSYIQRKAPPVRCTNTVNQQPDIQPWLLHQQHREVDPLLYCVTVPGGQAWKRYISNMKGTKTVRPR